MDLYALLIKFFPRKLKKGFNQMIVYSNIRINPNQFLGFLILAGIAFSLYAGYFLSTLKILPYFICVILSFAVVEIVFYFMIMLSIDSKAKFVESVLPDALQLMSSNIRGGLTTDRALLLAARPEFGPLAEEIKRVGRETMTGSSLSSALLKMNQRIKSENLSKTMDLIVNSIKSGGKLADLLDQVAGDLRDQQMVQKEISASVLLYVIFIFIAIGFAAPLLFSMSSFLVDILSSMNKKIGSSMPSDMGIKGAPISMTNITISHDFLLQYAVASLLVSSIFGSFIMGLILKGKAREGLRFAPILVFLSVGLYFLGNYLMDVFFRSIIKI